MATDLSYPHVHKPNGQPAHLKRFPRIRIAQLAMDYLAHGWSAEELCRQHPYLSQSEAHAAMAYYFDHQDEIDNEIQSEWQQVQSDKAKAEKSPFYVRLHAQGKL